MRWTPTKRLVIGTAAVVCGGCPLTKAQGCPLVAGKIFIWILEKTAGFPAHDLGGAATIKTVKKGDGSRLKDASGGAIFITRCLNGTATARFHMVEVFQLLWRLDALINCLNRVRKQKQAEGRKSLGQKWPAPPATGLGNRHGGELVDYEPFVAHLVGPKFG